MGGKEELVTDVLFYWRALVSPGLDLDCFLG